MVTVLVGLVGKEHDSDTMVVTSCHVIYLFVAKGHGGVVVSLVDPGGFEDHLVDQGSGDASENGSKPVNLKSSKIKKVLKRTI
jgi:hypothetical protein